MVSEELVINVPPAQAYSAVAEVKRMARWSPECFAVWIWLRRADGQPARFVGWNRRGAFVWFTTCSVVTAAPGEEFAFEVTSFGAPIARWGYHFAPTAEGGTTVTETWQDRRRAAGMLLGRIFTGKTAKMRPEVNREGMRETLRRLKSELEGASAS